MNDRLSSLATQVHSLNRDPVVFLHVAVFLSGGRTLGDAWWRLVKFSGEERISAPFEFELELHGNTSVRHGQPLRFADVMGRPVTVGIQRPALSPSTAPLTPEQASQQFAQTLDGASGFSGLSMFNGIVAAFSMEEPGVYRITMRPALWKLSLTNGYRVHRGMSVCDAIDNLLKQHRIDFSVDAINGQDNLASARVQDWLQAGETDYDLLQRLMAKAHVYYYHVFEGRQHRLVFSNRPAYPNALPQGQSLRYCHTQEIENGPLQSDLIYEYRLQQSMRSSVVHTTFTREEAAWERDEDARFETYVAKTQLDVGELPFNQYQIFQYGGSATETDHFASSTASALEAASWQFSGSSSCSGLHPGHRFSVTAQPRADQRPWEVHPELEGMSFVVTQVQHEANLDGSYSNKFQATDAMSLVTPYSLAETQQGAVLAEVVRPQGANYPGDWRRYAPGFASPGVSGLRDADAQPNQLTAQGVYVRFSTDPAGSEGVWIKLAPHMQTAPEVGSTVLVTRAQDHSELPEIQSVIQANGAKVIMPSGWTANTTQGSAYSTVYGDGQSIRFGLNSPVNLPAAVQTVQSKYQTGTYRETSYGMGASYSFATSNTGASGLLSDSDSLGSTRSTHRGAFSRSETEFETTFNQSTVTGDATSISDNQGITSNTSTQNVVRNTNTTAQHSSVDTVGMTNTQSTTGVAVSQSITGTRTQSNIEGASVSSNVTGVSGSLNVAGVTGQVSATGASASASATGVNTHLSMTGVDSGESLCGVSSNVNTIGVQNEDSMTGFSTRTSLVGTSQSESFTGISSDTNMVGSASSTNIRLNATSLDVTLSGANIQVNPSVTTYQMAGPALNIVAICIYL